MKRIIGKIMMLLVLLYPTALAQEAALDHLTIEEGWMSGTVTAISKSREYKIKMDCPIPENAYPSEVLTMEHRYISKKDMQQALEAVGQNTEGRFQNHRDYTKYTGNWSAEASAGITWEDAFEQATRIGLAYFDALGVEVERTPRYMDRPYDYNYYMKQHLTLFSHEYSDLSYQLSYLTPQWKRTHRYDPEQTAYTKIVFTVMVEGMRLWHHPSYPAGYTDEPDAWVAGSVSAHVIVSDSGILVEAVTDSIPEIRKRRPIKDGELEAYAARLYDQKTPPLIAADSWQAALSLALDQSNGAGALALGMDEQPYQNQYMANPGIRYARQGVITAIKPYLFTLSANEWTSFWFIESVEEYEDGWRKSDFW